MFGKDRVSVFEYEGDVVQELIQKLGLTTPHDNPSTRKNKSLNSASIKILRTINQYDIKAKDKALLMPHLKEINAILEHYANDQLIDDDSKKRVLKVYCPVKY